MVLTHPTFFRLINFWGSPVVPCFRRFPSYLCLAPSILKVCGLSSLDGLVDTTVPKHIRLGKDMVLEPARSETEALAHLGEMIDANELKKSFIGMGYYETITPAVILRTMFENPGWYTAYTPYQAEISQVRRVSRDSQLLCCSSCYSDPQLTLQCQRNE